MTMAKITAPKSYNIEESFKEIVNVGWTEEERYELFNDPYKDGFFNVCRYNGSGSNKDKSIPTYSFNGTELECRKWIARQVFSCQMHWLFNNSHLVEITGGWTLDTVSPISVFRSYIGDWREYNG